ncbi:hypothetical protein LOS78_12770 [Paracoccus sp. MA]|uniref:phage tail tube protein n=1 Tax=Paracoccus sp. MA TaxID=2895796 RepID=UPI001E3F5CDB|nr:hypothetical protein [Paracoccus sp. MA]UFM66799.1 hypothetical protein LOS78_12770 [Paracoccus sp. MA]
MSTILTPLDGLYTIGKGVAHFRPRDSVSGLFFRLGDMDNLDINVEVTETERYSNEYSVKTLSKKLIDQIKVTVTMGLAQLSDLARAAAVMGKSETYSQEAETGKTLSVSEPGIYKLDGYGIRNLDVDKSGVPAVEGVDYKVDPASGFFEALTSGLELTYDIPEISDRWATGIASGTGIRGTLIYRGTNAEGVRVLVVLHDVELRPSGARSYISASDIQIVNLTGTAYPVGDETHPIGYEMLLDDEA